MSKIGLLVFTAAAIALASVSYAADKITLTCSGTYTLGSTEGPINNTSLVIDLDRGIVRSGVGLNFSITKVTETDIEFKEEGGAAEGRIDRISGSPASQQSRSFNP